MVSLETTFLVDLLNGVSEAVERARELDEAGEPTFVTALAAEVLIGAYHFGGRELTRAQEPLDALATLDFDREAYHEAGRLGAQLLGDPGGSSAPRTSSSPRFRRDMASGS